MAKRLQHRGGTTSQHSSFTGAVREVTVDTDKNTLVVHDGALAGGHPLATATNFTSTGIDDNATSTAITINSSEQVAFTDGTASLPSITNLGDENTGMFFPSANQIGFATNGAETVRISATGAMALGTNDATTDKLYVFNGVTGSNTGTGIRLGQGYNSAHTRISSNFGGSVTLDAGIGAGQPEIYFKTNNILRQKLVTNGDVYFYEDTGTTPKFVWDASAEALGIGTSSPSNTLHVNSTSSTVTRFERDSGANGYLTIGFPATRATLTAGSDLVFEANGAVERMRITSTGNVGISTSSPSTNLQVKANDNSLTTFPLRITNNAVNAYTQIGCYAIDTSAVDLVLKAGGYEGLRIDKDNGNVGIGTSNPDGNLHIMSDSAGTVTASTTGNDLVVEGTGATGISILTPNDQNANILFGDPDDNDTGAIQYRHSDNSLRFFLNGTSEKMQINSSGNVGIGTSSPAFKLEVNKGSAGDIARFTDGVNANTVIKTSGSIVTFGPDTNNSLVFQTNNAERVRVKGDRLLISSTGTDIGGANTGGQIETSGTASFNRSNFVTLFVQRRDSDGSLVDFVQDGVTEGSISVSGATVSYNGFTGTHWSRFIDESKPDVLRGTVMESLDQMTDWYNAEFETSYTEKDKDGNDVVKTTIEKKPYALKANEQEGDVITYAWEKKDEEGNDIIEQVQATIVKQVDVKHVMSKISDTVEAKNVYGVFSAWDNDDLINNDFYVASVGSFVVRIKQGETIAKGDLLQSNGDGTAKVQTDDAVRSSSFAKVLSTTIIETYEDGSFIVPCSLMC
jgi:hypothetical protein